MLSIMTTTIMIIIRPTSSMSLYLVWYLKHLPKKNPKTEQNEFPSRMSLGLSQKDNHRRISYLDAMRLYLQHSFPTLCPLPNISVSAMDTKDVILLCVEETMFFFWRNKEPVEEYWRRQKNAQLVFFLLIFYIVVVARFSGVVLSWARAFNRLSVCLSVCCCCCLPACLLFGLSACQHATNIIDHKPKDDDY